MLQYLRRVPWYIFVLVFPEKFDIDHCWLPQWVSLGRRYQISEMNLYEICNYMRSDVSLSLPKQLLRFILTDQERNKGYPVHYVDNYRFFICRIHLYCYSYFHILRSIIIIIKLILKIRYMRRCMIQGVR